MNISTDKESILAPLQKISGVVEKRQTLPILSKIATGRHSAGKDQTRVRHFGSAGYRSMIMTVK